MPCYNFTNGEVVVVVVVVGVRPTGVTGALAWCHTSTPWMMCLINGEVLISWICMYWKVPGH